MKVLLDTHILLWYFDDDPKLPLEAHKIINDNENEIYYSSLSIFEVELKHMNRPDQMPFTGEEIIAYCAESDFKCLALNDYHTLALKNLMRKENTPQHRDPFDRLMLCQAIVEDMKFMTHDARIAEYVTDAVCKI